MESYNRLGSKTYRLFLYQRLSAAFVFLLISIALFIFKAIGIAPEQFSGIIRILISACAAFAVIGALIAFISSYLVYRSYGYYMTDDALKIKSGVITSRSIAIPYRQIQSVNIERTFSEQMMGLSRLIVATAGSDDPRTLYQDESKGILPAIDEDMALDLQDQLLKKADTQKIFQTKSVS